MSKELTDGAKIIEAILFIENIPLKEDRICSLTGLKKEEVEKALSELKEEYTERNSGLYLFEEDGEFSFQPVMELYPRLRLSYGRKVDKRLSKAALETLSIVAYKQPITRIEVDHLRGVTSSDTIIRLLRERDYVKVIGRADTEGHPCLYGTTRKFLYEFELKSLSDLPQLSEADRLKFDKEKSEGDLFNE